MKMYDVVLDRYDLEFDNDQPVWVGKVVADSEKQAGESALSEVGTSPLYRHVVRKVTEAGEADPDYGPGVYSGDWEF